MEALHDLLGERASTECVRGLVAVGGLLSLPSLTLDSGAATDDIVLPIITVDGAGLGGESLRNGINVLGALDAIGTIGGEGDSLILPSLSMTGTAVRGSTTNLQFTTAIFYGLKAVSATAAPTDNTAPAYMAFADAAGTSGVAAGSPAFCDTILAGSYLGLAQTGTKYNLADLYFLGTTGDKVLVVYTQ